MESICKGFLCILKLIALYVDLPKVLKPIGFTKPVLDLFLNIKIRMYCFLCILKPVEPHVELPKLL